MSDTTDHADDEPDATERQTSTDGGSGSGGPTTPRRSANAPRGGLSGPDPDERPHPTGRRNAQGIRIDPEVEATRTPRTAVISAVVEHEPGVLANVSGLFRRRQFNIESLTVGPTEDPEVARMTIVTEEPDPSIRQIEKQLEKLVPVRSVTELEADALRRELALIKVDGDAPDQVGAVAEMYDATTVDVTPEAITVEVTGAQQKIDAAVRAFEQFGVREIKRTGTAALERGAKRTGGNAVTVDADAEDSGSPGSGSGTEAEAEAATDGGARHDEPRYL
jgi:acetolactate synthase-1/3 small subunit